MVNCRLRDRISPTSRAHLALLTPICHVRDRVNHKCPGSRLVACKLCGFTRFYTRWRIVGCVTGSTRRGVHQAPLTPICHVRNRLKHKGFSWGMRAQMNLTWTRVGRRESKSTVIWVLAQPLKACRTLLTAGRPRPLDGLRARDRQIHDLHRRKGKGTAGKSKTSVEIRYERSSVNLLCSLGPGPATTRGCARPYAAVN